MRGGLLFMLPLSLGCLAASLPAVLIYRDGCRRWGKGWLRAEIAEERAEKRRRRQEAQA